MTLKMAILDDFQGVALGAADWSSVADRVEITVFNYHLDDESAIAARLHDFDILLVMRERTPLRASLLGRLDRLKLILTTGGRNASIDIEVARQRGIPVCRTDYSTANGALEHTWALILAALRHIPREVAAFRGGGWQQTVGVDLGGKVFGIVGLGHIGQGMAKVAAAFGMDVIAWSQNLTAEAAAAVGARLVDKETLLRSADIVTLHVILSHRTRGIIGRADLGLMKPSAWLVNTARGPLVDEAALIEALEQRRIAGAALDVFDIEPVPADHPFRRLDSVVATPHIGFVTENTYRDFYGDSLKNLVAWLDGTPIRVL
jgi:phosphoglycerate dehydrogenase-like enzyme